MMFMASTESHLTWKLTRSLTYREMDVATAKYNPPGSIIIWRGQTKLTSNWIFCTCNSLKFRRLIFIELWVYVNDWSINLNQLLNRLNLNKCWAQLTVLIMPIHTTDSLPPPHHELCALISIHVVGLILYMHRLFNKNITSDIRCYPPSIYDMPDNYELFTKLFLHCLVITMVEMGL